MLGKLLQGKNAALKSENTNDNMWEIFAIYIRDKELHSLIGK